MRTKRSGWMAITLFSAMVFTACQKEVDFQNAGNGPGPSPGPGGPDPGTGGGNAVITGDWNFLSNAAETYVSLSFSESGQSIRSTTTSDYVTEDNTGSLTITNDEFLFKAIGYNIDDTAHSVTYMNGLLVDNSDQDFTHLYPPTDTNIAYVRNSGDSLTFTNAIGFIPDPAGGSPDPVPAGPVGAKITVTGDTLHLTVRYDKLQTVVEQGIPLTFNIRATSIMRFKNR